MLAQMVFTGILLHPDEPCKGENKGASSVDGVQSASFKSHQSLTYQMLRTRNVANYYKEGDRRYISIVILLWFKCNIIF